MNNFTMKKYLTNTVEYWGRIRIAVECIQFWNVGFEYLQESRIFVEYPVFGYSVTPLFFTFTYIFSSDFQCAQFRNQNIDKEYLCACSNLIHFFWKIKQGSKRNPPQLHLRSIVWRYSTLWQNFDTQSLKLDAFCSQEGFSYST